LSATSYMEFTPPDLGGLLNDCKQIAILEFKQNKGSLLVLERFIKSVMAVCDLVGEKGLTGVGPVQSQLKAIRLDSLENFEADVDKALGLIKENSGRR
jgi:hypothetical protein